MEQRGTAFMDATQLLTSSYLCNLVQIYLSYLLMSRQICWFYGLINFFFSATLHECDNLTLTQMACFKEATLPISLNKLWIYTVW